LEGLATVQQVVHDPLHQRQHLLDGLETQDALALLGFVGGVRGSEALEAAHRSPLSHGRRPRSGPLYLHHTSEIKREALQLIEIGTARMGSLTAPSPVLRARRFRASFNRPAPPTVRRGFGAKLAPLAASRRRDGYLL